MSKVFHVATGYAERTEDGRRSERYDEARTTWCGRRLSFDFAFKDAGHVTLHLRNGGSHVPCRKCLLAIRKLIDTELERR